MSGVRCVHTHPNGNPLLSGVDISALKNNRFDAMIAVGVTSPDISQSQMSFGMITGIDDNEQYQVECYGPLTLQEAEGVFFPNLAAMVERILDKQTGSASLAQGTERAIIVGMEYGAPNSSGWTAEDSLEELKQLADTAGAEVVARFLQKRPKPDPAFFIGRGKVQELALYVQQENVDLCIFDDELSPAQQRNIEQSMGVRVLDRTALILDIFAQRAHTNEGKLQVELAQLQYSYRVLWARAWRCRVLAAASVPAVPAKLSWRLTAVASVTALLILRNASARLRVCALCTEQDARRRVCLR